MSKNKFALLQIEFPALEQSKEGKLRGGFTVFGSGRAGDQANNSGNTECVDNTGTCQGNNKCKNNAGCTGNEGCKDNSTGCSANESCVQSTCAVITNKSASTCGAT